MGNDWLQGEVMKLHEKLTSHPISSSSHVTEACVSICQVYLVFSALPANCDINKYPMRVGPVISATLDMQILCGPRPLVQILHVNYRGLAAPSVCAFGVSPRCRLDYGSEQQQVTFTMYCSLLCEKSVPGEHPKQSSYEYGN